MPEFPSMLDVNNLIDEFRVFLNRSEKLLRDLLNNESIKPSASQINKLKFLEKKMEFIGEELLPNLGNALLTGQSYILLDTAVKRCLFDLGSSLGKAYPEQVAIIIDSFDRIEDSISEMPELSKFLTPLQASVTIFPYNDSIKKLNEIKDLNKSVSEVINVAKNQNERIRIDFELMKTEFVSELNKVKNDSSKDLAELELRRQQANFLKVAKNAHTSSIFWITILTFLVTGASIIGFQFSNSFVDDFQKGFSFKETDKFFVNQEVNLFYYELIKRFLLRLLLITLGLVLIKFSMKNYNALRHIYTVNMHKSSCFGAVYDISRAITDETTRSTLINLAGKEIFTQSKSGYLSNEETKLDLKFLEKVGAVFNKKSEDV